jgi:tetratricopeptide (TPR) repeat protein
MIYFYNIVVRQAHHVWLLVLLALLIHKEVVMKGMRKYLLPFILLCVLAFPARAGVWDMDLPYQGDDPQWAKAKAMWDRHWDGKNLDEIIGALAKIQEKDPDKAEPYLWLSRIYYLKARWERKDRQANYQKAENYAVQAHEIDKGNLLALKLLVDTMSYSGNTANTLFRYGDWIRGASPLPVGEALPPQRSSEVWNRFVILWAQRVDVEKGKAAVKILEELANANPNDGFAQLWACRGNYYLGEYYTSVRQHDDMAVPYYKRGAEFGEKVLKIMPYSVPAHYWYQLNVARSIQYTGMLNKARHFNTLLKSLVFCSRENNLYYFFGPALTLATMITNGGWVTEKGMQLTGITLETELDQLELAEILYPDYFYIPYAKADVLAYKGRKDEALIILEKLLTRNPDANKVIAPENRCFQRMAQQLCEEMKKGK